MIRKAYTRQQLAIIFVCFLYLAACADKKTEQASLIQIQLNRANRQIDLARASSQQDLRLPLTASGFDCYLINVMASDIGSRPLSVASLYPASSFPNILAGSSCFYPGIQSVLKAPDNSGNLNFSLQIPSGNERVIQLLGIKGLSQCLPQDLGSLFESELAAERDPAESLPGIYELARQTTDLFPPADGGAFPLSLEVNYDPFNAKHAHCRAEALLPPEQSNDENDDEPSGGNTISVTIGTGDFTPLRSLAAPSAENPKDIDFGHFRSSGVASLVINYESGFVRFYEEDASGEIVSDNFYQAFGNNYSAGSWQSIQRIDIDGDGWDELATELGSFFTGFYRLSAGVLSAASLTSVGSILYRTSSEITVADYDGDGLDDLGGMEGGTSPDTFYALLRSNGDGTFANSFYLESSSPTLRANYLFDMNNDGHLDWTLQHSSGNSLQTTFGNGLGEFSGTVDSGLLFYDFYSVGHFDDDKFGDLVLIDKQGDQTLIYTGNGDGSYAFSQTLPAFVGEPQYLLVDDFNKDDHDDLIVFYSFGSNGFRTYLNDGTGVFSEVVSIDVSTGEGIVKGFLHDFNDDGVKDVVILQNHSDPHSRVLVYTHDTEVVQRSEP